jgi:transcription elongation factor
MEVLPMKGEPSATDQELNPGDRVEGLGNVGRPTGEFGTVEQTNEDDAVVKWDDDGRTRLPQRNQRKQRLQKSLLRPNPASFSHSL